MRRRVDDRGSNGRVDLIRGGRARTGSRSGSGSAAGKGERSGKRHDPDRGLRVGNDTKIASCHNVRIADESLHPAGRGLVLDRVIRHGRAHGQGHGRFPPATEANADGNRPGDRLDRRFVLSRYSHRAAVLAGHVTAIPDRRRDVFGDGVERERSGTCEGRGRSTRAATGAGDCTTDRIRLDPPLGMGFHDDTAHSGRGDMGFVEICRDNAVDLVEGKRRPAGRGGSPRILRLG